MNYQRYAVPALMAWLWLGWAWTAPAAFWGGSQDDRLGDDAVGAGDYLMAVRFYQRWYDGAEDATVRREAAVRLAGACIRAGMIDRAATVIAALRKMPPGEGSTDLMLLDAELLSAEGKAAEVRRRMEKLLLRSDLSPTQRLQALELLGRSLIVLKEWSEAVKVFSLLERTGQGTRWQYLGFCKRVYALIMDGQAKEAAKLLTLNLNPVGGENQFEARVLSLLLLVKEKQFKEFREACAQLRQSMPARPDPLMFQVMMEAADNYLALKNYPDGLFCLDEAVIFAPDRAARNQAFRLLIGSAVAAGQRDRAVKAAENYLRYNRGEADEANIIMEVAALLATQQKSEAAVKLYFGLMDDHTRPLSLRLDAAMAAGNLLAAGKKFAGAEKAFGFICRNGLDNARQAEGYMALGKIFFEQEFYLRAAEVFGRVGELSIALRPDAAYWTMRSYLALKENARAGEWLNRLRLMEPQAEWLRQELLYYAGVLADRDGRPDAAAELLMHYAAACPEAEHAPEALFRAGDIATEARQYARAADIFRSFADKYPAHASAPAALYRRLEALFLAGSLKDAEAVPALMRKKYPASSYTPAAMFWLVDCYRDGGDYAKAKGVLNEMISSYPDRREVLAEALRDLAVIAIRSGDYPGARAALLRLTGDLADTPFAAEGCYLLGDIYSENGDYDAALNYYGRALKQNPAARLQWAIRGRLADCNYSLYARNGDEKYLQAAIAEYRHLLNEKELPARMREQSLFKLGKCYELHKDFQQALQFYKEVVYGYGREADAGRARRSPVWVVNAAQAAIEIYLSMDKPESAMAAIKLYHTLERMKIDTGENFASRIETIRQRYNMK